MILKEECLNIKPGKVLNIAKKYKITDLLHYEEYPSIIDAISREKQLKNWQKNGSGILSRKRIGIYGIYLKTASPGKNATI